VAGPLQTRTEKKNARQCDHLFRVQTYPLHNNSKKLHRFCQIAVN
jgi:hypothetical protein